VGDPLHRNLEDISNDFNIDLDLAEFKPKIQSAYLEILNESKMPPNPCVKELLIQAHSLGLKTGICTSSPLHQAKIIERKIESFNFKFSEPAFNAIVSGDMVRNTKPHPEPYITLCEKLDVPPSHCIAIEDSHSGLTAAKKAGCYTIALKNIYSQNLDFSQIDAAVDSLVDILLV
jgi:HAD superfamily hydrolase (TIGR01509 family)